MVNSVNTNVGAIIALQSLNRTNSELDAVQKRVATGYRVADAADDGAAFAVAQGLRADVKGLEAVGERLSASKGLLTVTQEALRGISDTLGEVEGVLVKLSDASLSAAEFAQYEADYLALKAEVVNFVAQASFNGQNLLNAGGDITIIFDAAGGTKTLTDHDITAKIVNGLSDETNAANYATHLAGDFATFQTQVGTALADVGGEIRSVENQASFLSVIKDSTEAGIGAIVDADLAKESAKLQSLQIRQQLGTQSLSIANQTPSILLSLFRG